MALKGGRRSRFIPPFCVAVIFSLSAILFYSSKLDVSADAPPPINDDIIITTNLASFSTKDTDKKQARRRSVMLSKLKGGMSALSVPSYIAMITVNGELICGGTLFNASHVLTAGHCCVNPRVRATSEMQVSLGLYNVLDLHSKGNRRHRVKACHFYAPNFINRTRSIYALNQELFNKNGYDIALLELSDPQANQDVSPVKLFESLRESPAFQRECLVIGYGRHGVGGGGDAFLEDTYVPVKTVHVPLRSPSVCNIAFGKPIPSNTLCAGSQGHDACTGDSGGPLFCEGQDDGIPRQVGIVSYGKPCESRDEGLSVYTDVRGFMQDLKNTPPTYTFVDHQTFLLDISTYTKT
ncbi:protein ORF94 [Cyprinid herpesvirus 1]|uniref:Protein ORF94 n=1 Tax=Cyprinid herpesvirus 1 TaxID=317858 RepID=K7PBL9_9VIRU|nr:protein ORF94 [Cyprinid herpesvirus 1]AFJ20391.1 protein ORF94 [Cyprinid herpesvirus 1]